MNLDISEGKYSVKKDDKGKFIISPDLKKVLSDSAQMTGGVSSIGDKALRTASKLKALTNKEKAFYNKGKDATKRMADKKVWDKLMFARAKLLDKVK